MTKLQIRQLNRMKAREAFMTANETDFPVDSVGGRTLAALRAVIVRIEGLAARKASGKVSQKIVVKDLNFEKMERVMRLMNKASRSMAYEVPGIEELYRIGGNNQSEEAVLAKARDFYTQSEAHKAMFIDYALPDDFRDQLKNAIDAASISVEDTDAAQADRGGAVGALREEFRDGSRHGNKLDGIVKVKYADDPDRLAAWLIASHLRAADSEDEEEAQSPTDNGEN